MGRGDAHPHSIGLKSTATIMYGHIEQPEHWARHLLFLRDLQVIKRLFRGWGP